MFLRKHRKKKRGISYEYWTLVESVRTARGPRQRTVATIGKLPGLDKEEKVGWKEITRIVRGIRQKQQGMLFAQEDIGVPEWATVNVRDISVENVRDFGDVFIGLLLWKKLELDKLFDFLQIPGKEEIEWKAMFCLSVIARLCAPSSELAIAERWYDKTALADILGITAEKVNDDRLYRTLDYIIRHKDAVCTHLQNRYHDLFGTKFDFLLYDVTSTYFEGMAKANPKAKRGYSRDHRPDCLQVCIGLVVTEEGLPVGYEMFDGNRAEKEHAIIKRQSEKLEIEFLKIQNAIRKNHLQNAAKAGERIGRWRGKYTRAEKISSFAIEKIDMNGRKKVMGPICFEQI